MAVEVKIGVKYRSADGLDKFVVTGFYRRYRSTDRGGILCRPEGSITSGLHLTAITLAEWWERGFQEGTE